MSKDLKVERVIHAYIWRENIPGRRAAHFAGTEGARESVRR